MKRTEYIPPIRVEKIELKNFKNVRNGVIEFNCLKNPISDGISADILGIYGQNGSGKTTMLDALYIAKLAMMGEGVPEDLFGNIISQNADKAEMTITFQFKNQDESFYHVEYHFSLENKLFSVSEKPAKSGKGKKVNPAMIAGGAAVAGGTAVAGNAAALGLAGALIAPVAAPVIVPVVAIAATTSAASIVASKLAKDSKGDKNRANASKTIRRLVLSDEVLSLYGSFNGTEIRLGPIFDTREVKEGSEGENVFLPKAKHKMFFPQNTAIALKELQNYKTRYRYNSKSFIFCDELSQMFLDQGIDSEYANIIMSLKAFAIDKLQLLDTKGIDARNGGIILLYTANRVVMIKKSNSSVIMDDEDIDSLKVTLGSLNIALEQVLPGLHLEAVKQIAIDMTEGTERQPDEPGSIVRIYSVRDDIRIPIAEESAGIIRLVTVLGLISYAFVNEGVTVAVDEIDAGIFEQLLRELLHAFQEKGVGQLIFSSHNLIPMERLDKKFICFTTTNPENRYLKPKSIRKENNLRDVYLKDDKNQDESLYDKPNHIAIAAALKKAGDVAMGKE